MPVGMWLCLKPKPKRGWVFKQIYKQAHQKHTNRGQRLTLC
ncbi:hypothetical protein HBZS_107820 [Helicobacter bizzozeronii CCUG 35545]|nr:hypothetical protein HBZS_107820 [Helicobacter bizzozeronii CCUG 35545]